MGWVVWWCGHRQADGTRGCAVRAVCPVRGCSVVCCEGWFSLVDDFHLLTDGFSVDCLEDGPYEVGAHAAELALCAALLQDFVVASRLEDGHGVFLLEGSDFAADAHALGENLDDVVVALVDLRTQLVEVLGGLFLLADNQEVEDVCQHVGGYLLCGVTPGAVGVAVALDDESVEAQVHCLLAEGGDEFAFAADVAGVAEDGQVGDASAQLDGDVPLRQVAVYLLVVGGEAAVDGCHAFHACIVEPFHASNPEFEVGVDGVLHEDGDVHSREGVGNLLHGEGICTGACANPQHVHAGVQCRLDVLGGGDFGGDVHARLLFYALQPGESRFADAFEASGLGARFPDSCAEDAYAAVCQFGGSLHDLFFSFGAARAGYDDGAFGFDAR